MKMIARKCALIHILRGGYWLIRVKDEIRCVRLGKDAREHVRNPDTLANRLFLSLTSNPVKRNIDDRVMVCMVYTYSSL